MSHTSAPPKITLTSRGAKVLLCTYRVAILNYSQKWEMLLGALSPEHLVHCWVTTCPWPVYPESSFTFRIVWFYQWGGVVFTSQCWRVFGSTCSVLCVRSFILPARTDMSNLKGQKGGLKGGQDGGEWVEGKWHQTKHTCWVSFPVQPKHWACLLIGMWADCWHHQSLQFI